MKGESPTLATRLLCIILHMFTKKNGWLSICCFLQKSVVKSPSQFISSIEQLGSSCPEMFCKKAIFRNFAKFTGKHPFQCFMPLACNIIEKKNLAQVLSSEFRKILKNTFSYWTWRWLPMRVERFPESHSFRW